MSILKSILNKWLVNPASFFAIIFLITAFQVMTVLEVLRFDLGAIYTLPWLSGSTVLALNVSIVFTQALYSCFIKTPILPEIPEHEFTPKKAAILLCVKDEAENVLERIRYTLKGNFVEGAHFWLLSDSSISFQAQEENWIVTLKKRFGPRVFYRWRPEPFERKQGNLADWFDKHGRDYEYFFVLDADSTVPEGAFLKLLRKAEHPLNRDIGIFQSAIYIVHDHSLFAKASAIGQFYAQKLYFTVNQAVFGRSISFGHNCLIRSEAFRKIRLPLSILSHDNWDVALAERADYRTAFVTDTVTFEEATQNYLEERARAKRWMKGSLQGWPIPFMNGISWATRYFIFYQIYLYLMHPILLAWILFGLLCSSRWFEMGLFRESVLGISPLIPLLIFTLVVLYAHKFLLVRSLADLKRIAFEVLISSLISLNNIFYITLDLFSLPFEKLIWKPMGKNPNLRVSFFACAKALLTGTLFGASIFVWGLVYSPYWIMTGLPILISLILSIPTVYMTSKNLVWRKRISFKK